jgi:histone deacetylase complex regulatory component SIN3
MDLGQKQPKLPKSKKNKKQPNLMQATNSQIPQNPNNSGGSPPFGFEHAITYVTKIKTRFERDSAKYTRFLDILHDYKEDKQSIEGVLEQVSELFRDHPDLLKEFAYFLPEAVQAQGKNEAVCWWCVGGVLVVCWWCVGGVLVVCWWCVGGVSFKR